MNQLTNQPQREQARRLALDLMALHGLTDWRFSFNQRKRHLGLCRFTIKTIELSVFLVERNGLDEIRDTILHEIAHALVGPGHGHDGVWKQKCLQVGARPQRCNRADMPRGRWRVRCGGCGRQFYRHRRPKVRAGMHCRLCGPERGELLWLVDEPNGSGEEAKTVASPPG